MPELARGSGHAKPFINNQNPQYGATSLLHNRWNFTPSPGWTKEEAAILKLCLMKYGVGKWVQILETGLLPGKLIQQLNGQAQRLLGQQSLAGVMPPTGVTVGSMYKGAAFQDNSAVPLCECLLGTSCQIIQESAGSQSAEVG